jgi:hypothetical protein
MFFGQIGRKFKGQTRTGFDVSRGNRSLTTDTVTIV